jgi:ubiquinone/menaquinone biosynthesis C-methylase UbiE
MSPLQQPSSAPSFEVYGGTAPENYEHYFVPVIGAPLATDLIAAANLKPGERVLDVACGTGIIARLAAEEVGPLGRVVGLDINPWMLAVARTVTPHGSAIEWCEGSAESLSFPDRSFDAVLCQLGFQFFADKLAALQQMRRVVTPPGRIILTVPGPTPELFEVMEAEIALHVSPDVARFLDQVFSVHDVAIMRALFEQAGFADVEITEGIKQFRLPAPADFLWQYAFSTPLAAALAASTPEQRSALEHDVVAKWQQFVDGDGMVLDIRGLMAAARS